MPSNKLCFLYAKVGIITHLIPNEINNTSINKLQLVITIEIAEVKGGKRGCRHSSVDSFAPSILPPRV